MTRNLIFRSGLIAVFALFFTAAVLVASPPAADALEAGFDPPSREQNAVVAFPVIAEPDPVVRWMVDQVDEATVWQYTGDLSGEWPVLVGTETVTIHTRHTNSGEPIQKATQYVGEHLAARGLTVDYHRWGAETAPNVIGEKRGEANPSTIYMITAHLDNMPAGELAPGADDNASGSAAVLVAADILSQFRWNCTLRFALWTGEEQGLLGSDKYAQRSKNAQETIAGVLNLDMIGWNTPGSTPDVDLHAKSTMPGTVELANQMASVISAYDLDLVPEVRTDGTGGSDHASFWKYGFTAILGIEDYYPNEHDFHPDYHTVGDLLSTLDVAYYTEYVRAAVGETAHMAGCLVTGDVEGQVSAAHDGAGVPNARVTLADGAGREYVLEAGSDGSYAEAVPPGTYTAVVSAYGYGSTVASGIVIGAGTPTTRDAILTALAPAATTLEVALDAGEVSLSWPHISPNTGYQLHRSDNPYFEPASASLLASLDGNHPPAAGETQMLRDADSGAGAVANNHFYAVVATNAAGAGALSGRSGEFDFALVAPTIGEPRSCVP